MGSLIAALRRRLGIVALRQLADELRHRLSFLPGLYAIGALVIVHLVLIVDDRFDDRWLPDFLSTTVDSARSIFAAIATGSIASITLLLSMMLVTVQLASSNYSPRTLRDWIGDRTVQHSVGFVLGTTVFCLFGLRATRSLGEGEDALTPHLTVLVAVVLGVAALFMVVRAVDHITRSLQVGSVADRIARETVGVVRSGDHLRSGERPSVAPAAPVPTVELAAESAGQRVDVPDDAAAIESLRPGWIQQIDVATLLEAIPAGSTAYVVVPLGGYISERAPLLWISPAPSDDDACRSAVLEAFAIGATRTLQQDIGFGLQQLTDIAVRALSPGVNDPGTANDIVVHLGNVLTALWEQPIAPARVAENGRTVVSSPTDHGEHLRRALEPVRRYGRADATVVSTLLRTLRNLAAEVERRDLVGPDAPIAAFIETIAATADTSAWSDREVEELRMLATPTRTR